MKHKYVFAAVMLLVLMLAEIGLTNLYVRYEKGSQENQSFHVVTSFYPVYVAAKNIIGDCEGVTLENLSEPQTGCMHDYQLTATDMKVLAGADAFVINGGGIESFLSGVAARYPSLSVLDACERVRLLEDNAHAWMSISDYMIQVQTISDGLCGLDAVHRQVYQDNTRTYLEKLEALRKEQTELAAGITPQNIIIFHEAFAYTARDLGLTVTGQMDLDEERQVSAGEVADILAGIREHEAGLVLAEELYGKEMGDMVSAETGLKVVWLDTCVRGTYEADSYLKAMEQNLKLLRDAVIQQ